MLIGRSGLVHKSIGFGVALAGAVYLVGSGLRFFAPDLYGIFAAAYIVPVATETAFCVALLLAGLRSRRTLAA